MPPTTQKNPGATANLDGKEAAATYLKAVSGQPLTDRERAVLKRFEREREATLRWQYYASIPQKHWRAMSDRQTKVLNEQAKLYGIPFGGATINLPDVVKALHDFLAANARKLGASDDPMMNRDPSSPALERYREERYALARLDRLEREKQLVPRDQVREGLGHIGYTWSRSTPTTGRPGCTSGSRRPWTRRAA